MTIYQFPTTRRRRAKPPASRQALPVAKPAPEQVGLIQGQPAKSILEWRVAVALERLRVEYEYQVPIRGGGVLGGLIVDFVIYTPFQVPLEVFGEYWHRGQATAADRLKIAVLFDHFKVEPIILFEQNLATQDQAIRTVRKALKL